MFGLHIATYVLCELAGKPILNPLPIKNRKKLYERLYRDLLARESKLLGEQIKYALHDSCFTIRSNLIFMTANSPSTKTMSP